MMSEIKFYLFLLSIFIFSSCNDDCIDLLDKSQFIYSEKSNIVFMSNLGNIDTIYVYNKQNFYNPSPDCYEIMITKCFMKSDLNNFEIQDIMDGRSIVFDTYLNLFEWKGISIVCDSSNGIDTIINGKYFENVYHLKRNSQLTDTSLLLSSVYFNFRFGVVCYQNIGGETFTIDY